MSESPEYKAAKLTRRNAKASLTRSGRVLQHRIANQRSVDEIQEMFANVEKVYNDLVQKHEKFTELIEEDKEFEVEEHWLEECQQQFLSLESRAKEYVQKTLNEKSLSEKADKEQAEVKVSNQTTENTSENTVEEISSLNMTLRKFVL
jgi:23S rRNA G2445 N2-methylase RlmL